MEQERKSYVNGFPLVLWSQKANGKRTLVNTLLIPICESCSAGENGFAMKLFYTWLLKSMYAAHFQLLYDTVGAATCWHIWLLYSRPRNHMARALENWYWPLTTRSCRPIGICVRSWRNNETLSCGYGLEFLKRPLKNSSLINMYTFWGFQFAQEVALIWVCVICIIVGGGVGRGGLPPMLFLFGIVVVVAMSQFDYWKLKLRRLPK
jgi:hypothetical protein